MKYFQMKAEGIISTSMKPHLTSGNQERGNRILDEFSENGNGEY